MLGMLALSTYAKIALRVSCRDGCLETSRDSVLLGMGWDFLRARSGTRDYSQDIIEIMAIPRRGSRWTPSSAACRSSAPDGFMGDVPKCANHVVIWPLRFLAAAKHHEVDIVPVLSTSPFGHKGCAGSDHGFNAELEAAPNRTFKLLQYMIAAAPDNLGPMCCTVIRKSGWSHV